jgi:hypothetical protein
MGEAALAVVARGEAAMGEAAMEVAINDLTGSHGGESG